MTDKRFYIVMTIAIAALIIGISGLAVGLVKPSGAPQSSTPRSMEGREFPTDSLPKDKNTQISPDGSANYVSPQQSGNVQQPAH